MNDENFVGWRQLIANYPWFEGSGNFSLSAYSEFMPPPRVGRTPYGDIDCTLFNEEDPFGWQISEMEEELELKPGMQHIAEQIMHHLIKLGKGLTDYHISGHGSQNLMNNPYWPPELSKNAGKLNHERYLVFLPLSLSRTQDDKGRIRWTFFGGSEQGPERAFWKSFYTAPDKEIPEKDSLALISQLLIKVYDERNDNLHSSGFKILPNETNLPSWTKSFLIDDQSSFDHIKYLLTFRPFGTLPSVVKEKYLAGTLMLLPFPGSLVFWGMPTYKQLQNELLTAMQIPLLKLVSRHSGHGSIRVPQSCWLHEPHPDVKPSDMHKELIHDTYHRTHRWQRVHRHEDELAQQPRLAKLVKALFSTDLETLGLYDKPLARNCQLWTKEFNLLIDGTKATRKEIFKTEATIAKGGLFGYRFLFPPMQVGTYEIYWQRPLIAYLNQSEAVEVLSEILTGYMAAYKTNAADLNQPVELWPRFRKRQSHLCAIHSFVHKHEHYAHQTSFNIINLFDCWELLGKRPLPLNFARHLLKIPKHELFEKWFDDLHEKCNDESDCQKVKADLKEIMEPADKIEVLPPPVTYEATASRSFEEAWWNDIRGLAHGQFINKDNADCVSDDVTLSMITHHHRDLEKLGDYLISRHRKEITGAGMEGKALCGELPFSWRTDFVFDVFGGWRHNQEGKTYERNILVVIPGKNRREAVIMGDHYDTAYMEDVYEKVRGGSGARLSAAGADDNYSATSTLLQAAPIFLKLSREGKLERDIWLIHLTGEEFPSDCLGARYFCQSLIEKNLKLHLEKDEYIDLSGTRIVGTFVMDMIGHNRDNDQDIFQISPGKGAQSLQIAYQAYLANLIWNKYAEELNKRSDRYHCKRGVRSPDGLTIPAIARYLPLMGEVRTHLDPHSSLYNTDCQIFSDVGVPVVLFMENYDLNRSGYHDTKDTMENIDLDYGAALAAIAIETAARVAQLK